MSGVGTARVSFNEGFIGPVTLHTRRQVSLVVADRYELANLRKALDDADRQIAEHDDAAEAARCRLLERIGRSIDDHYAKQLTGGGEPLLGLRSLAEVAIQAVRAAEQDGLK